MNLKKNRLCVSIETTGVHLGLSLYQFSVENKSFLRRRSMFVRKPFKQSDMLIPELSALLKRAKLRPSAIDLFAVNNGPGSFTGVRVGVAAARALSQALKKPLIGISGLEAMAYQYPTKRGASETLVVTCLPASSDDVYYAAYKKKETVITVQPPQWRSRDQFDAFLKKQAKKNPLVVVDHPPHPNSIAELAIRRFWREGRKDAFSFRNTIPVYLQPTWAERKNGAS